MFFAVYRLIPDDTIETKTALVSAITTTSSGLLQGSCLAGTFPRFTHLRNCMERMLFTCFHRLDLLFFISIHNWRGHWPTLSRTT